MTYILFALVIGLVGCQSPPPKVKPRVKHHVRANTTHAHRVTDLSALAPLLRDDE